MPRLSRYMNMSIAPCLEKKHFSSMSEAVSHFGKMGYKTCDYDTRTSAEGEEVQVMVLADNPRDYVEIIKRSFMDINTVRYRNS